MYLNSLTEEQKKAFLVLAMKLVGADRRLDPRERKILETMRYEMGLWQETDLPRGYVEELTKCFNTRRAQTIVLVELIALAYADENFCEQEQKMIRELALIFNFSEEEATHLETWVLSYRKLQTEMEEILGK